LEDFELRIGGRMPYGAISEVILAEQKIYPGNYSSSKKSIKENCTALIILVLLLVILL
jgi:hypothetical protein